MKFRVDTTKVLAGVAALILAVSAPLQAQVLWYNGGFNGVDGLSSEQTTAVPQSMVYDNFTVDGSGWAVTGVFGDFLSNVDWTQAFWEVRTGVSAGNGGSLVASGTSSASKTATGESGFEYNVYRAEVDGLSLFLAPGEYWLGISPIGGDGRAFVATTSGTGGVNSVIDKLSFFNSPGTFSANFIPSSDFSSVGFAGGPTDFSYGVLGSGDSVVPEPASMTLLATGLVGLAGFTGKKRRRR